MERAKIPLCEGGTKTKTTLRQCYQNYSAMETCTEHDLFKRFCEAQIVSFITIIITVIIILQNEYQCFHFRRQNLWLALCHPMKNNLKATLMCAYVHI